MRRKQTFLLLALISFFSYSCNNCPKTIEIIETWKNGTPRYELQWISRVDSTYIQNIYYENGQVYRKINFTNGKMEKLIAYYETGEIKSLFIYNNSRPVVGASYYKNGQKKEDIQRDLDGKINGLVMYYYEDGAIWQKGYYKSDKLNGLWREYDESGNITSEILYDEGKEKDIDKFIK